MAINGQNALLNSYVPTFYIKNIQDGQQLVYDSVRKAFVNYSRSTGHGHAHGCGGGCGCGCGSSSKCLRLGELLNVDDRVDNTSFTKTGQALVYNEFTSLWENRFIDYDTLLNVPVIPGNDSFSFIGLSDTAIPSLPDGYVRWDSTGTQLIYSTSIPAASITGLAEVAYTGDYNDLINTPPLSGINTGDQLIVLTGDATNSDTSTGGVLTLATVNFTPGTFGNSQLVPTITVNAKGLVTEITTQHVDTTVRDQITDIETVTIAARHQYIVTSELQVDGYIINNGVIAIL